MKLHDLKRGMRCTRRDGKMFVVDDDVYYDDPEVFFYENEAPNVVYLNKDLTSAIGKRERDIVVVEDITVDGFKVIWERPDKKYYLTMPNSYLHGKYLNYNRSEGNWCFGYPSEDSRFKTKFTKDEIENFPRQDFIKSLIKEEV